MAQGVDAGLRARLARSLPRIWESRGALSLALMPLAFAFAGLSTLRRALYRRGYIASSHLPARVVVVGNLVVGGAGKTPAVIAIVATLRRHGFTPGIISRGYGRARDDVVEVDPASPDPHRTGDEPLVLARRTGVPVVVGRDRVAAGHALLHAHPNTDVIVCDDGLQHLALERDVEVLVFDERGAGNGRLLPAGPLRQSIESWNGAAAATGRLVLYNSAEPTTALRGFTGRRTLAGVAPLEAWWRGMAPSAEALASLRGRKVVAAAGIARPGRFFAMLREQGLLVDELPLPDHHDFTVLPWPAQAGDVVVTEKDAVKIPIGRRIGARIWVATLDFEPGPGFDAALLALLSTPATAPNTSHGNPPA
jgi:tetraacyldisaccharide 4'-kinase